MGHRNLFGATILRVGLPQLSQITSNELQFFVVVQNDNICTMLLFVARTYFSPIFFVLCFCSFVCLRVCFFVNPLLVFKWWKFILNKICLLYLVGVDLVLCSHGIIF